MFKKILLPALAAVLAASSVTWAAYWYGDYGTDFMDPVNWSDYASPNGDLYIRAVPIGPVSHECTLTTPYNGGILYIVNGGVFNEQATSYFSGGIACYQAPSLYVSNGTMNVYPASPSTNNSVRIAGNLYIGVSNGNTGIMNIMPEARVTVKGGSTLTIGGSSSGSGGTGILNLYGHIDFTNLRLRWNNMGNYTINVYPGCEFWWSGYDGTAGLNSGIAEGRIVSPVAGYVPVADFNSVDNYTLLTAMRGYKATIPSPADDSTIAGMSTPSQSVTLSWTKPLPENVSKPVTSDVYFGTASGSLGPVATGISGNSVSVTVDKLQTYYWRVDSTDPNKAVPLTPGDEWTFNTNNTAASVSISAPYQTTAGDVALWLPGNTSATINSVIADDGYPLGGPTSYLWERQNLDTGADPNWYTVSTSATCTTPTYSTVTGTDYDNYNYRLTYNDGELATARTFLVRVFRNTCIAAPRLPGYVSLTGEFSGDCKVSFMDFAALADNWQKCNAVGGLCN